MRDEPHSVEETPTRPAYDFPATSERPSFGAIDPWQPAGVQLAVKMGCTLFEKETPPLLEHWHAPDAHVCPPPQVFPHAPQLLGSVCVSTHAEPHGVPPPGHEQAPFWQASAPLQTLPQAPQLFGSVCVSTHVEPHEVPLPGHEHVPPWQAAPPPHVFPHAPQLFGSLVVSMQLPAQAVVPGGHAHAPLVQLAPNEQAFPHPPQLSRFVDGSTHELPH